MNFVASKNNSVPSEMVIFVKKFAISELNSCGSRSEDFVKTNDLKFASRNTKIGEKMLVMPRISP